MILYSRNDCPLCEDVEQTLQRLGIIYTYTDIDLDNNLKMKYHTRVPLLVNANNQELAWPFEDSDLQEFANHE